MHDICAICIAAICDAVMWCIEPRPHTSFQDQPLAECRVHPNSNPQKDFDWDSTLPLFLLLQGWAWGNTGLRFFSSSRFFRHVRPSQGADSLIILMSTGYFEENFSSRFFPSSPAVLRNLVSQFQICKRKKSFRLRDLHLRLHLAPSGLCKCSKLPRTGTTWLASGLCQG